MSFVHGKVQKNCSPIHDQLIGYARIVLVQSGYYFCEVEHDLPSGRIDLYAEGNGKRIGVECVVGSDFSRKIKYAKDLDQFIICVPAGKKRNIKKYNGMFELWEVPLSFFKGGILR